MIAIQRPPDGRWRRKTLHTARHHVGAAAGRWTSIVGPNGAGKSTLLRVLAGLMPVCSGHGARCWASRLAAWPRRERAPGTWPGWGRTKPPRRPDCVRRGHAGPPAAPGLAGRRPARRPRCRRTGPAQPPRPGTGVPRRWASSRAASASACCWRALLAVQAQVLLMDEPLANLDPPHQADWLQLVRAPGGARQAPWSACCTRCRWRCRPTTWPCWRSGRLRHHGAAADAATPPRAGAGV
jgi:iron complex transport system ATP-binding protein